jgi:hypothetical protein
VVLVILIPWVIRNVISSGYLVYPIADVDLFDVDWKLPYDYVVEEKLVAHGWARIPTAQWRESLDMAPWEWIPRWLGWISNHDKIVMIAALVAIVVYIAVIVRRSRGRISRMQTHDLLYFGACLGVLYWFTNAPDLRFGWGFMFIALVMPLVPAVQWLLHRFPLQAGVCLLALLLVYVGRQDYVAARSVSMRGIVLAPQVYPREPLWSQRIGSIVVNGASTGFCWDAPLPCTPIISELLRARGDTLASGFRRARVDDAG